MHNIYKHVAELIAGQLLTAMPDTWECPWHRGTSLPINAKTSHAYRGINILTLWATMMQRGYADHRWATYRQWCQLGAQVRKGERGSPCIFYKSSEPEDRTSNEPVDEGTADTGQRLVLRVSTLFNTEQVDGAPVSECPRASMPSIDIPPHFTTFVEATGARVVHLGNAACFIPIVDEIHMPVRKLFHSTSGYVTTLCHELTHWTGAKHRLDRDLTGRFGTQSYAAEELVAELGSAFLPASLGLTSEPPPNHAAYIANWLPLLRSDPRALFAAASHASRAADWLFTTTGYSASPYQH